MSDARNIQIAALAEQAEDDYLDHGFRFVDGSAAVGDELAVSWSEEEEREMAGTCAFETWEQVAEYAKHSTGAIVMITGAIEHSGHLAGEIIVSDATVVATWTRENANDDWA